MRSRAGGSGPERGGRARSGGGSDECVDAFEAVGGRVVVGLCSVAGVLASSAFAEGGSPWWNVLASVAPTNLPPGGMARIVVTANNLGDGVAEGSVVPITVSDKLPAGIVPIGIYGGAGPLGRWRGMLA